MILPCALATERTLTLAHLAVPLSSPSRDPGDRARGLEEDALEAQLIRERRAAEAGRIRSSGRYVINVDHLAGETPAVLPGGTHRPLLIPALLSILSYRGGQGNFVGGDIQERSRSRDEAASYRAGGGRGGAGGWGGPALEEGRDDLRRLDEEDERVRQDYAHSRIGGYASTGKGESF